MHGRTYRTMTAQTLYPCRCEYIAMQVGAPLSSVIAMACKHPGILVRSPIAAVSKLRAVASVLGLDVSEVAGVIAERPELLLSSGEAAQLTRMSGKVLREITGDRS